MTRFQHTAARRRLPRKILAYRVDLSVSTHSRTKAAALDQFEDYRKFQVSTHSRTKAAASRRPVEADELDCFNTQPHGGGCQFVLEKQINIQKFQHTAARRRLPLAMPL